jgi:hypothetical protein
MTTRDCRAWIREDVPPFRRAECALTGPHVVHAGPTADSGDVVTWSDLDEAARRG